MNTFRKLFAVSVSDIREDVVITPFLKLEYFRLSDKNKINRGFLFEVLNEKDVSVIKTGVGASFVGDAVMYLKETKAKRVYFIGSCGAVSNLKVGDLVIVSKVLNMESFSKILNREFNFYTPRPKTVPFRARISCGRLSIQLPGPLGTPGFSPGGLHFLNAENALSRKFIQRNSIVKKAKLATLGSLSLQENVLPLLRRYSVDIVDMEVSSFICAAEFLELSSLALLYVTDIIKDKPFCRDLTKKERDVIQQSRQKAISLLCEFIRLRPNV